MINEIKRYDKAGMYEILKNFSLQIKESIDLVKNSENIKKFSYNKILFCGIGGSAIGATFVQNIIEESLTIPSFVNNNYSLPNWVDQHTLIIIISYSGNTEEIISCYEKTIEMNIKPWIITSGGYLLKEAKDNGYNHVALPKKYPPRTAFGFMSSILLLLLTKNNLINKQYYGQLNKSMVSLKKISSKYTSSDESDALSLAQYFYKKNIIIYSSPKTKAVGYRFKSQLAENTKLLSYFHYLPELSHNDIEGYKNLNDSLENYVILWLLDPSDDSRIFKSVTAISKIISKIKNQKILKFDGESLLMRQYHLLYYLDCVSFYLSILYKTDPSPVETINKLKTKTTKC